MAQDVVVGRPRDGDDRVSWLLDHGKYDKALAVCDSTRGLKASTHEKVSFGIPAPAPHASPSTQSIAQGHSASHITVRAAGFLQPCRRRSRAARVGCSLPC